MPSRVTRETGLSRVLANRDLVPPGPFAFVTSYASITPDYRRGVDALVDAGVPLTSLLTPEHGYWGASQAGESDGDGTDPASGLPILDTYRADGAAFDALLAKAKAPTVLVDLQDIGTRFYTYTWTLYDLLCSAARTGIEVVVLDRPNPLGRGCAGPGLEPGLASFVGRACVPLVHGRTIGELARWFSAVQVPQQTGSTVELSVIEVDGDVATRQQRDEPWVLPSPNMPTLDTATLYPATGLIEGTTLSEGRGTTRPFELIGAGWTDARLAATLRDLDLPGLAIREAVFVPMFSKWSGERVHGVQLHLLDAQAFDPIRTGYALLHTIATLYPQERLWRDNSPGRPPFIDLLWGSPALRTGIDDGATLADILTASPPSPEPPAAAVLYPDRAGS